MSCTGLPGLTLWALVFLLKVEPLKGFENIVYLDLLKNPRKNKKYSPKGTIRSISKAQNKKSPEKQNQVYFSSRAAKTEKNVRAPDLLYLWAEVFMSLGVQKPPENAENLPQPTTQRPSKKVKLRALRFTVVPKSAITLYLPNIITNPFQYLFLEIFLVFFLSACLLPLWSNHKAKQRHRVNR